MSNEVALTDADIHSEFSERLSFINKAAENGDEDMRWRFRCAEALYWQLKDRYLFEDFGFVEANEKPLLPYAQRNAQSYRNIIRKVRYPSTEKSSAIEVLKCATPWIAGSASYDVLRSWRNNQLPCANPRVGSVEEVCLDGLWQRVEYMVMDYVDGFQLSADRPQDNSITHQFETLRQLVRFIAPFHASGARIRNSQTWADAWYSYLSGVSRFIASDYPVLEWNVPFDSYDAWREEIEVLSAGDVLLHGNCRGSNVLVSRHDPEELVLVAPLAGIVARREWEMGIGCALEISNPGDLEAALRSVIDQDRTLSQLGSNTLPPMDFGVLAYAAGMIALFRAGNSLRTGVNEYLEPMTGARMWMQTAKWAMSMAWKVE